MLHPLFVRLLPTYLIRDTVEVADATNAIESIRRDVPFGLTGESFAEKSFYGNVYDELRIMENTGTEYFQGTGVEVSDLEIVIFGETDFDDVVSHRVKPPII